MAEDIEERIRRLERGIAAEARRIRAVGDDLAAIGPALFNAGRAVARREPPALPEPEEPPIPGGLCETCSVPGVIKGFDTFLGHEFTLTRASPPPANVFPSTSNCGDDNATLWVSGVFYRKSPNNASLDSWYRIGLCCRNNLTISHFRRRWATEAAANDFGSVTAGAVGDIALGVAFFAGGSCSPLFFGGTMVVSPMTYGRVDYYT